MYIHLHILLINIKTIIMIIPVRAPYARNTVSNHININFHFNNIYLFTLIIAISITLMMLIMLLTCKIEKDSAHGVFAL